VAQTKYSAKLQADICKLIAKAVPVNRACTACGIHKDTFYGWMHARPAFSDAVEKARSEAAQRLVELIEKAADGSIVNRFGEAQYQWQAAAWLLERTQPDEFARKSNVEVSGPDGGAITIRQLGELAAKDDA